MIRSVKPTLKGIRTSLNNKPLSSYKIVTVAKGVYILRDFNDAPLYKPSAGKILVYTREKKDTDIVFKHPPIEKPVFKEGVVYNVFKK